MIDRDKRVLRRRLAGSYVSSVTSISLVLLLIGMSVMLSLNARAIADRFLRGVQVTVLMDQGVDEAAAQQYGNDVSVLPFVSEARVVSREEGLEEMKQMLGEDFFSVFGADPIPVSVEITLAPKYVCADSLGVVREGLEADCVDQIECQQALVEKLGGNLRRVSLILLAVVALLLFISVVLVCNTVRHDVFSRRFTIHTMQLVGATLAFIRRPFMGRAALQGLAASLISLAALAGILYALCRSLPQAAGLMTPSMLAIVAGSVVASGMTLCLVSTFFVVGRLAGYGKEKLYY